MITNLCFLPCKIKFIRMSQNVVRFFEIYGYLSPRDIQEVEKPRAPGKGALEAILKNVQKNEITSTLKSVVVPKKLPSPAEIESRKKTLNWFKAQLYNFHLRSPGKPSMFIGQEAEKIITAFAYAGLTNTELNRYYVNSKGKPPAWFLETIRGRLADHWPKYAPQGSDVEKVTHFLYLMCQRQWEGQANQMQQFGIPSAAHDFKVGLRTLQNEKSNLMESAVMST